MISQYIHILVMCHRTIPVRVVRLEALGCVLLLVSMLSCSDVGCPHPTPSVITIPTRICVLKGTALATYAEQDRNDQALFNEMNKTIWNQANIVFLGCCQDIPVINDPDPNTDERVKSLSGTTIVLAQKCRMHVKSARLRGRANPANLSTALSSFSLEM